MAREGDWAGAKERFQPVINQMFAYAFFPAVIEAVVQYNPFSNDKKKSWAQLGEESLIHTMAGGYIGFRDLVDAALHKKDPSVGLLSTAGTMMTNFARDLGKTHPMSREHMGRLIQDTVGIAGPFTGTPIQAGKAARFIYDYNQNRAHPRSGWDWWQGLRHGQMK